MKQASFRDPDGFLVSKDDKLFRIILTDWEKEMNLLQPDFFDCFAIPSHYDITSELSSELCDKLKENGLNSSRILKILEVEKLEPITYPWEWTPTMLLEAGCFTIYTQLKLMESGLTLKDASFFNIQFQNNKIFFLDLLSVKRAVGFYPWVPYGQFLRHFVYPATLIKYNIITNLKSLWSNLDGFTLEYQISLLPLKIILNLYELIHYKIGGRVKSESYTNDRPETGNKNSKQKLQNLLEWNLTYLQSIRKRIASRNSFWSGYYDRDVDLAYFTEKRKALTEILKDIDEKIRVLDIGSNIGEYSSVFLEFLDEIICLEKDIVCCEHLYSTLSATYPFGSGKKWAIVNSDIVNPDPGLGWMNTERKSLIERIRSDLVSALGIIHHLYFTESIDLHQQSKLFCNLSKELFITEFISSDDEKVKIVAHTNPTRLKYYDRNYFLGAFSDNFKVLKNIKINETRELFLFSKRTGFES